MPKKIEFKEKVVVENAACGGRHTLFKTKDGQLYSCGHGAHGQTGLGTQDDVFVPTLVKSIK